MCVLISATWKLLTEDLNTTFKDAESERQRHWHRGRHPGRLSFIWVKTYPRINVKNKQKTQKGIIPVFFLYLMFYTGKWDKPKNKILSKTLRIKVQDFVNIRKQGHLSKTDISQLYTCCILLHCLQHNTSCYLVCPTVYDT